MCFSHFSALDLLRKICKIYHNKVTQVLFTNILPNTLKTYVTYSLWFKDKFNKSK